MEQVVARNEVFTTEIRWKHPYINRWYVPKKNMKLKRFH
jgi:hypothetical protein